MSRSVPCGGTLTETTTSNSLPRIVRGDLPLNDHGIRRSVRNDLPLLEAIVSGGQTGADIAGLRAAVRLGLATGGHAPRGWLTQDGPNHRLGTVFGLVEGPWDYTGRTKANVRDACATVRFAQDFLSPGERCTIKAIQAFKKPHLDVGFSNLFTVKSLWCGQPRDTGYLNVTPEFAASYFREFLIRHDVRVLNVAGNSARTAPGIEGAVEAFLVRALGAP